MLVTFSNNIRIFFNFKCKKNPQKFKNLKKSKKSEKNSKKPQKIWKNLKITFFLSENFKEEEKNLKKKLSS